MKKLIILLVIGLLIPLLGACDLVKGKTAYNKTEESSKYSFVGKPVKAFEVKDFEGQKIDESIYKAHKLTMNVFWSPNCAPCIEELTALDELHKMEKQLDFKLVSVCVEGNREDVTELKQNYKMSYPIIMMDEKKIMEDCVKDFEFIPFVIFVDQKGCYMKEYLVGSRTYEEYLEHLTMLIKKYNKEVIS